MAAKFVFSAPLKSGNVVYPGDGWIITITGGSPGQKVTASGTMPTGSYSGTSFGQLDANGNFAISGQFASGDKGAWNETWYVDGLQVGQISFLIEDQSTYNQSQQQQQQTNTGTTNTGQTPTNSQQQTNTTNTNTPTNTSIFGLFGDTSPELISGIPISEYTLLGLVGVAAVLMFMGGKR